MSTPSRAALRCPLPMTALEASARDFESAVVLPGACYSDPTFFEFEMQALYAREWICVGRSDLIPNPGDYFTITVIGEPLVVVRNQAGAIRVMSSVCRHRGMVITAAGEARPEHWLDAPRETSGNLRAFRCPYHWWTYDLDGQLVGAPQMERTPGFDKRACALPALRVELWMGFVFVNFDADAPPLSPRLTAIERFMANWHFEDLVSVHPETIPSLPFNWKIMVENFMEGYHPDRLHHGIHEWAPSSAMEYAPYHDGDGALYGWTRATHPDGGFNASQKGLFPPIETLTQAERWLVPFLYVPPSLLIGMQSDSAFWFTVLPTSATTHTLSMSYVFPRATTRLPLFHQLFEAAVAGVGLFNNQDLPTNTAVQVGMRSRFAPRGRYCWQEAVCAHFNRWLVARYRAHDVRARG